MILWNEQRLEELIRKMGLRRTPGQGKTPPHLSLYCPSWSPTPLLTKIMQLNAKEWQALGYAETDRVSVVQYLGNLGCRTGRALRATAVHQRPLTPELARVLIDAGCDPTAQNKNGWDALVWLAWDSHPVDPQVTDLFLSAGCRTDLDGCKNIFNKHRLRFNQILKQHAQWKEVLGRISAERPPADSAGETTPRPGRW